MKDALLVLPDQAAKDIDLAWFQEGENIRVADAFVVDILLNANGYTFEALQPYSQTLDLNGIPVKTIDLQGLLLKEKTLREKEQADCQIIERALAALRQQGS